MRQMETDSADSEPLKRSNVLLEALRDWVRMQIDMAWLPPIENYHLPLDEVHVWRAKLEWPAEYIANWYDVLSRDERERAERYHFQVDRNRHVIGRFLSKILIGRCLHIKAASVSFTYDAKGKPRLANNHGRSTYRSGKTVRTSGATSTLNFNISHSGDYILVALAYGRDLGVDIERIRKDFDPNLVAKRFFAKRESLILAALPESTMHDAFFACWTRKEAYVKAHGEGLDLALDQFDVAFLPGEEAQLLETRHDPAEASRWVLRNLDAGENYKAALAIQGSSVRLKFWEWPGELP